jgi:dTMP kinase
MSGRGRLFALEGIDGSGKTTQAVRLAEQIGALRTREPGGTDVGERLRQVVLDPDLGAFDDRAEALVMAACRAQHVHEVLIPTLEAGRDVVTDRYIAASLAYQGAGRGLGIEAVSAINEFATVGLTADLVILLDVPDEVARGRLSSQLDRIEQVDADFSQRVRDCYRTLAAQDPEGWVVVDATGAVDEVADQIKNGVDRWLARRP